MFCYTSLYVHPSFAIILIGKRELVALLSLSSWCLVFVVWLFLAVPLVYLRFVIVVFPDHTHLLFLKQRNPYSGCPNLHALKINKQYSKMTTTDCGVYADVVL